MRINIYAAAMVTLLLLSGLATIPIGHNAENDLNSPGVWAQTRYFIGYIGNLTPENHDDVNLTTVLQITGVDTNTTPPTILGPWPVYFNLTTMEFSAEVDLDFHDYARPWEMHLLDRYGWNETGGGSGGIVPYPMPENFVKLIPEPELIPNGTLYYIPGVFGNLSLKIINLTSGEPLPGVRFNFLSHDPFVSANSGLQTDENG
ncbi:MAG: hypothetical protein JW939_03550, partial [Candidatus Thermoplasmatota archaeon]|nr:hypothetical protein [Candidatus Thermoplasmatota archaeon]